MVLGNKGWDGSGEGLVELGFYWVSMQPISSEIKKHTDSNPTYSSPDNAKNTLGNKALRTQAFLQPYHYSVLAIYILIMLYFHLVKKEKSTQIRSGLLFSPDNCDCNILMCQAH